MKIKLLLSAACIICGLTLAIPGYSENIRLNNGTEYTNVTVMESDEISITIDHDNGTSRIKYFEMSSDLKQKYGYSAEKEQEYYRRAAAEKQALAEQNAKKTEEERKKAEEQQALLLKLKDDTSAFLKKGSLCVFKSTFYTDAAGKQHTNKESGILAIEYNNYLLLENETFVKCGAYTTEPVVQYLLSPRNKRAAADFKSALQSARDLIKYYDEYSKLVQQRSERIKRYNDMNEANRKALAGRKQYDVSMSDNISGTIVETTPLPYSPKDIRIWYTMIYVDCDGIQQYSNFVRDALLRISQGRETFGGLKTSSAYNTMTQFYKTGRFGQHRTKKPCIKSAESNIIIEAEQLYTDPEVDKVFNDLSKISKETIIQDNISRKFDKEP